jgi:hypothetical protein
MGPRRKGVTLGIGVCLSHDSRTVCVIRSCDQIDGLNVVACGAR